MLTHVRIRAMDMIRTGHGRGTVTAPYTSTRPKALELVQAHSQSEFSNNIDGIMATISADVYYVVPDLKTETDQLVILTDRSQGRNAYELERQMFDIQGSDHLVEVSSEFFVFYESLATIRAQAS